MSILNLFYISFLFFQLNHGFYITTNVYNQSSTNYPITSTVTSTGTSVVTSVGTSIGISIDTGSTYSNVSSVKTTDANLIDNIWINDRITESYINIINGLLPTVKSKNFIKRHVSEQTLKALQHLLEKKLREVKGEKKLTKRDNKKKSKFVASTKTTPSTPGEAQWDEWTPWSSCSVTCGKGRHIRWRHCRENCDIAEIEMEEKSCQMPACPQKLFGLINL